MRRDDQRFAAAARDYGLRKVSKITWRVGAAGVVCSALIAAAFGHHVAAHQPSTGNGQHSSTGGGGGSGSGGSSSSSGSSSGSGGSSSSSSSGSQGQGTILVPAQPPSPASGGGQVTSGAS